MLMAQSVQCLPHKHEDLSSDSQYPGKKPSRAKPGAGETEAGAPLELAWLVSLASGQTPGSIRKPVSKDKGGDGLLKAYPYV